MDARSYLLFLVLGSAPAALAQDVPEEDPGLPIDYEVDRDAYEAALSAAIRDVPETRLPPNEVQWNVVSFGGGAIGLLDGSFGPDETLGVTGTFRYTWQPAGPYGFELAYTGRAPLDADNAPGTVVLLESSAKLSAVPDWSWSPVATAGIGWGLFADVEFTDWTNLTLPVSVGLEAVMGRLLVGGRAIWRPTFYDRDLFTLGANGSDTWGLAADVGARF